MQEYAPGGDLYAALAAAGGFLSETQVASCVMLPLLTALAHVRDQARPTCSGDPCRIWFEGCDHARGVRGHLTAGTSLRLLPDRYAKAFAPQSLLCLTKDAAFE